MRENEGRPLDPAKKALKILLHALTTPPPPPHFLNPENTLWEADLNQDYLKTNDA